jgi:hypothetical protein
VHSSISSIATFLYFFYFSKHLLNRIVISYIQVQSQRLTDQVEGPRINSTFQGLKVIARSQGWRQLFAGLSLNYIKVMNVMPGKDRDFCKHYNLIIEHNL